MTSHNFTKKDMINSRVSISMKDVSEDTILNCIGAAVTQVDRDGTMTDCLTVKTDDGNYYSTISSVALRSADDLMEIMEEEGGARIKVIHRTSKGDREFISINIL